MFNITLSPPCSASLELKLLESNSPTEISCFLRSLYIDSHVYNRLQSDQSSLRRGARALAARFTASHTLARPRSQLHCLAAFRPTHIGVIIRASIRLTFVIASPSRPTSLNLSFVLACKPNRRYSHVYGRDCEETLNSLQCRLLGKICFVSVSFEDVCIGRSVSMNILMSFAISAV